MFITTFEQVLRLTVFVLCGLALRRIKLVPRDAPQILSVLEVNLLIPMMSMRSFSQNLTPEKLSQSGPLMLTAVLSAAAAIVLGQALSRFLSKDHYTRDLCAYSISVPNTGYVGAPLALAMFGGEVLMQFTMFTLPLAVFTYTIGANMILDRHGITPKSLLNAPMVGMLIGAALGLLRVPLPPVAVGVLEGGSNCVGPLAMLLTGMRIADFQLKEIFRIPQVYVVVALRMLALPLLMLSAARLLGAPQDVIRILALVHAMPTGLNTVVYPSSIGRDCHLGAGMACVSNLMALITIPLLFHFFL